MARKTLWIACLAGILALALTSAVASGRIRDIFDSAHDLGSPGNPTCRQCHIPHNATSLYLWARQPTMDGSGLQSLCLSCHDGSVTNVGWYIKDPRYVNHPTEPGSDDKDCNQCHNAHEGDTWKFLREYTSTGTAMIQSANVCATCHGEQEGPEGLITGAMSHPINAEADSVRDRHRDPNASPPDFSGTRVFSSSGTAVVHSGPGEIKCQTCHTSHGAFPGRVPFTKSGGVAGEIETLNTIPYSQKKFSPVCVNCHE